MGVCVCVFCGLCMCCVLYKGFSLLFKIPKDILTFNKQSVKINLFNYILYTS